MYIVQDPCNCGCCVKEESPRDLLKKKGEECLRLWDGASWGISERNAFYDDNELDRNPNGANRKQSNERGRRGPENKSQQKVELGKKDTNNVQLNNKGLDSLQKQYKNKREKDNKRSSSDKSGKTNRGSKKKNKIDNKSGNFEKSGNGDKRNKNNKGNKNGKDDKDGKFSLKALALQRSTKTDRKGKGGNKGSINTEHKNLKQKRSIHDGEKSKTDRKSKDANKGSINTEHENSKQKRSIHDGEKSKNTSNKDSRKGLCTGSKKRKRVATVVSLPSRLDEIRPCDIMRVKLEERDINRW